MSDDTKNVSFAYDKEKLSELDTIIRQMKIDGALEFETTRSDIIREQLDEWIEGNRSSSTAIAEMPA